MTQNLLRVITGPQQGAEIPLHAARYTVGSQDTCAIVLEGKGIKKNHLQLFFADGLLSVTQAQGPVLLEGAALEKFPTDIPPLKPITVGDISFAYGPPDGPWPTEADIPQKEKTAPPQPPRSPWIRLTWMGVLFLTPTLLGITAGLFARNIVSALPKTIPQTQQHLTLRALLLEPAFRAVRLKKNLYGQSHLSGHVRNKTDLNFLRTAAAQNNLSIDVVALDQLEDSLNTLLTLYGRNLTYSLEITPQNAIHLVVRGLVRNSTQTQIFEQILKRDLPQIQKIHVDVLTRAQASQKTQALLDKKPMFALINVTTPDHALVLSGQILGNFYRQWRTTEDQIHATLPQGTPLQNRVLVGPTFDGKMLSLFSGQKPHVRLSLNGQKKSQLYHKGSTLPGGWTLQDIQDKGILLSKQGKIFIYPFQ